MLLAPFDPMVCMDHDMVGKSKVELALSTTLFCISTYADSQQRVKTARDASVHCTKGIKMNFKKIAAGNIFSSTTFLVGTGLQNSIRLLFNQELQLVNLSCGCKLSIQDLVTISSLHCVHLSRQHKFHAII